MAPVVPLRCNAAELCNTKCRSFFPRLAHTELQAYGGSSPFSAEFCKRHVMPVLEGSWRSQENSTVPPGQYQCCQLVACNGGHRSPMTKNVSSQASKDMLHIRCAACSLWPRLLGVLVPVQCSAPCRSSQVALQCLLTGDPTSRAPRFRLIGFEARAVQSRQPKRWQHPAGTGHPRHLPARSRCRRASGCILQGVGLLLDCAAKVVQVLAVLLQGIQASVRAQVSVTSAGQVAVADLADWLIRSNVSQTEPQYESHLASLACSMCIHQVAFNVHQHDKTWLPMAKDQA